MAIQDKIGTSSWLNQVKRAPSRGGSNKLQELIKAENSLIADDSLLLDDLSEVNLATLKYPFRHHRISHKDVKVVNSYYKFACKASSLGP